MVKIAQAERIYVAIGITKIDQLGRTPGAKAGYFFEQRPWLGIETDVYTLKRDVEERTIMEGTTSGRVFAVNLGLVPLRLNQSRI
jgi:hypothetical protein